MRCCLMVYLLKVLSDIAPKPSTTFSFPHCPKLNVKLGPTDSFYPAPPSSDVIAIATNPRQIGFTDRDLDFTEMGLETLCFLFVTFWSHRNEQSVPPSSQCKLPVSFHNILVSPKRANRSHRVYLTNSLVS